MSTTNTNKLEYKGLVAWVEVDKKPTRCYSPAGDPAVDRKEKNVSCWIASEESKRFAVNFSASEPKSSLVLCLSLDGEEVSRRFYDKHSNKPARIRLAHSWTTGTTYRPFIFAPLKTTDDEEEVRRLVLKKKSAKNLKHLGEITLTVQRVVNLRITNEKVPFDKNESTEETKERIPQISKVLETTVKNQLPHHQVSYGERVDRKHKQKRNADGTVNQTNITCEQKELIASFTFRYLPLQVLRNLGKAPVPPPPTLPRVNRPSAQPPSTQALGIIPWVPLAEVAADTAQMPITPVPAYNRNPVPECDMHPIPLLTLPQSSSSSETPPPASLESSATPPLDLGSEDVEMKPPVVNIEGCHYEDEDDDDDGEEILKALQELQARVLKRQETKKRKRQEAASANLKSGDSTPSSSSPPSKKVKRELVAPMMFFSPGETKEVIDLTLC